MIPPVDPATIEHDSERLVYVALKKLPDGYEVLHSYPWLRPNRTLQNEPLREGEADFVVLHPRKGMLVIEVKGGNSISLKERQWYRSNEPLKDPFVQARRSQYALLDTVKERTAGRITKDMLAHGYLVFFPHQLYQGPGPVDAEPRIILDSRHLENVLPSIERAFVAWKGPRGFEASGDYARFRDAILPSLRLIRCVGSDITTESHQLFQLTQDQHSTLLGLLENKRVLVRGCAGSGKTLLAMQFALALAEQGKHVLFLCYNKQLATWLIEQATREERLLEAEGSLTIHAFHSYALALARKAQVEFNVPSDSSTEESRQFWDTEAPLLLEQAIELLRDGPDAELFDAIVVDEAQDFFEDWWITIESLSANSGDGPLYVFLDLQQSLRGSTKLPPVQLPVQFELRTNCRNTKAIARSATAIPTPNVVVTLLATAPEGEPPAVRRATSSQTQNGVLLADLRQLLSTGVAPNQIAIIGPPSKANGSLATVAGCDVEKNGAAVRVPLITDAAAWRAGKGVLVTTARSFKGLEADVVMLYDLQNFGDLFTETDLYVAWTRAKHRIIAVAHGGEVRSRIEYALAKKAD